MRRLSSAAADALFAVILVAAIAATLVLADAHAEGMGMAQATGPASPSTDADAEIRATVTRYAAAWYEGNANAMSATLHPEFVQQTVRHASGKPDALEAASGLALLDRTERGFGRNTSPAQRKAELGPVSRSGGIASVGLQLADRNEQLRLVLWNNRWRIVHALAEQTDRSAP